MQIKRIYTDFTLLLKKLATNSLINLYKLVNSWLKFYLNICVQTVAIFTGFFMSFLEKKRDFFIDTRDNKPKQNCCKTD